MRAAAASVRAAQGDVVGALVGAIRDQLAGRVLEPLDLVMIAADRVQAALDEAVERGRVTPGDARQIADDVVRRGREQTGDVLASLDELLGHGIDRIEALSRRIEQRVTRDRRADAPERVAEGADSAQRAGADAGEAAFPIPDYDELTVPRIRARLVGLSPDELRAVRDRELRGAQRKSVLAAVDRALS